MAGSAADLSGMLTGIANTVGEMGKPASALFKNLGAPLPDPNDPKSMEEYARWLQKMGRNEEALQYMQGARSAEASKLAAGREKREQMSYIQQEQDKSIAQTYFSLKDKPDERQKWIEAMQEAGKGGVIETLQQREAQIKRAEEAHEWAGINQKSTQELAAKKKAADNITKGWYQAQQKDKATFDAFVKSATDAGHGDVVAALQYRDAQYTSMIESNKNTLEAGQELDKSFFANDEDYALYKKNYASTPRVANERAVAEHRIRYQAETAKEMSGESRLTKWEDEAIDDHLEEMDSVMSRWWPEIAGGRPVPGDDDDRLAEVSIKAKEIYRKEGRMITKDEYMKLIEKSAEDFRNPPEEEEEDVWGIAE